MRASNFSFVFIALSCGAAMAQPVADIPPLPVLREIAARLEGRALPPAVISFAPAPGEAPAACGLKPHQLNLSRGSAARSYSVLLDRSDTPRQMFATVTRMTVDADGSARAYHPEDPNGAGVCRTTTGPHGRTTLEGVCALDRFSSGRLYLFRGTEKLQKDNLAPAYAEIWPLIRDRKLKPVSLSEVIPEGPKNYNLFHWREKNLTAFFKRTIIPFTHDGYPCTHAKDSQAAGYFVAATTLTRDGPRRADGCAPSHYIDAEQVPFFVLPGGPLGGMAIGDVVVARLKSGGQDRLAYGIAADIGPIRQLGEASIAFNQALLGQSGEPVMNVREVEKLDIAGRPIQILVLGGTKHLFNGDYSRANVVKVARAEFARWGGSDPVARLDACSVAARPNAAH